MEPLFINGKTINFNKITGEVLRTNKFSTTQVRSSGGGGGGVITQHGGYVNVNPTKISSTSTIHHEIWIRDNFGVERPIKLVGSDIPLREGQVISLITACDDNIKNTKNVALVNHSAQMHWLLTDKDFIHLAYGLLESFVVFASLFVIPFIVFIALGLIKSPASVVLIAPVITFFSIIIYYNTKGKKLQKPLDEHLEKIIQQTYAS